MDWAGGFDVSGAMQQLDLWLNQAEAYPRWLVVTGVVVAAILALWIVAKLFQWTLQLLFTLTLIAIVAGAVFWIFV